MGSRVCCRSAAGNNKAYVFNDLNNVVWEKLRAQSIAQGYFCHASLLAKKNALKELMTLVCAAIARGEVSEFEETMVSPAASSPARGEKRALEDTVVLDEDVCLATAFEDPAVAALSEDDHE